MDQIIRLKRYVAATTLWLVEKLPDYEKRKNRFWLGREDSNLRMAESKSAALPLGYAPMA
ncbi:hypothetical protein AA0483_2368 [Acetobacter syzygii NRIC 0483]|nr:hypothetical protein AA0483_2368 [Acetobacter syzygii NRIC 0483]